MKKDWRRRVYAAYRGEACVGTGTLAELSEVVGMEVRNLKWYTYPSSRKRMAERKETARRLTLVCLDDDVDESEIGAVARPWRPGDL